MCVGFGCPGVTEGTGTGTLTASPRRSQRRRSHRVTLPSSDRRGAACGLTAMT
jgi:hypothetical protein